MAYTPADLGDLSTIHGDKDANSFADIDPLGGAIFGWGNRAQNNEITRKNAKLAQLRAQLGEQKFNTLAQAVEQNGGDWSKLGIDLFGENGDKLDNFYSGVEGKDEAALQDLLGELGDYKNAADFFKDPSFMAYVGDAKGYQGPSAETLAAEKGALQQYKNLSTPQESAQEKLVRMMAQREMESNLAGDRDALARSLKSRGVYGSGAEIVGNMMSQGQQADRAALANAQANAMASQRAMAALGSYSDLAGKMRGAEANEGSMAQQLAEFNNSTHQGYSNTYGAAKVAATQAGEAAKGQRAVQGFTGTTNVNNSLRGDEQAKDIAKTNYTVGSTGNRTQGAQTMAGAFGDEMSEVDKLAAANEAKRKTSLLGIG